MMALLEKVEVRLINEAAETLKLAEDLLAKECPTRSDYAQIALKLNRWENHRESPHLGAAARKCAGELKAAGLCCDILFALRVMESVAPHRPPTPGLATETKALGWQALGSARHYFHRWESRALEAEEPEVELVRARVGGRTRKGSVPAACGHQQEFTTGDVTNTVFGERAAAEREKYRHRVCDLCHRTGPYVAPTQTPTRETDERLRRELSILAEA